MCDLFSPFRLIDEGRIAIVTNVGRDVVDAMVSRVQVMSQGGPEGRVSDGRRAGRAALLQTLRSS